MFVTFKIPVKE